MLPAYAGMILPETLSDASSLGAPRIRGDDPDAVELLTDEGMRSPHTRG